MTKLRNCAIWQLPVLLALTGCATTGGVQLVKVPVPIACQEPEPARPHMATDALKKGAELEQWVRAARAELKVREAYERQLRAAMGACTAPVTPAPAKGL